MSLSPRWDNWFLKTIFSRIKKIFTVWDFFIFNVLLALFGVCKFCAVIGSKVEGRIWYFTEQEAESCNVESSWDELEEEDPPASLPIVFWLWESEEFNKENGFKLNFIKESVSLGSYGGNTLRQTPSPKTI